MNKTKQRTANSKLPASGVLKLRYQEIEKQNFAGRSQVKSHNECSCETFNQSFNLKKEITCF